MLSSESIQVNNFAKSIEYHCIVCGRKFLKKGRNKRQKNAVTCSKECSKEHLNNLRKKKINRKERIEWI
jgi:DNA-directed RNA polymerase subunit RPC12/RpoP